MKKIKNLFILVISCLTILSCSEDDKTISVLLDNVERGVALRTLNFTNTYNVFNVADDVFKFDLSVEAQDQALGEDVVEIRMYQSFKDNTDDGTDNSRPEVLALTKLKSELTTSANGFPSFSNTMLLSDALVISNLDVSSEVFGGDQFVYRMEVELTDGRVFTNVTGGTVSGGSFFSSPFAYTVTIKCVPVIPFTGDYELDLKDSYGDGWDGAKITVTIDGTATDYTAVGSGSKHTVTVPAGTASLSFVYVSGAFEGEHSYIITGPFGVTAAEDGPAPATGEIILNICP